MIKASSFPVLASLLLAFFAMGCASSFSPMVQFTPSQPRDPRSEAELLDDLNDMLPFAVAPGDFVVNRTLEGPNCWVCFGSERQANTLVAMLERSTDWRVTSRGYLRTTYRTTVGMMADAQTTAAADRTAGMVAANLP